MESILSYEKKPEDDYYFIIGCHPSSSKEQIQAEYRIRALQLHPDKNPDCQQAQNLFQKLQVARDTLTNDVKRCHYDRWRASGISIDYETWCSMRQQMTMNIHWTTPNTDGRMLETSSTFSDTECKNEDMNRDIMHRRNKTWNRDTSDIIRKFRNYEI